MSAGLLLVLAASAAPDPAEVRASLVEAFVPIRAMGACAQARPRFEERYDTKFGAYVRLQDSADSLFGREPALSPDVMPEGCGERVFARYEAAAEAGLARTRRALARVAEGMPGLWVGTLRVCRDVVDHAAVEPLLEEGGMLQLTLTLSPALQPRLLALTEDRVGQRLSIRIDGEEIAAPNLYEPLTGGAMSVSAPERDELERVRSAALRACG